MAKQIKQIEYGYWWNCADCGTENAYGLTEAEAEGAHCVEELAAVDRRPGGAGRGDEEGQSLRR